MDAHRRCGLGVWHGRLTQVHTWQSLAHEHWISLLVERPRRLPEAIDDETQHLGVVFQFDGWIQVGGVKVRRIILYRVLADV